MRGLSEFTVLFYKNHVDLGQCIVKRACHGTEYVVDHKIHVVEIHNDIPKKRCILVKIKRDYVPI